jgi:hypothetical protein
VTQPVAVDVVLRDGSTARGRAALRRARAGGARWPAHSSTAGGWRARRTSRPRWRGRRGPGALAAQRPEVAELDCDPLVAGPAGGVVVDARVRVEQPPAPAPYAALRGRGGA